MTHDCDPKYWDVNIKQCLNCGITQVNLIHLLRDEPVDPDFISCDNANNPRSIDNYSKRKAVFERYLNRLEKK